MRTRRLLLQTFALTMVVATAGYGALWYSDPNNFRPTELKRWLFDDQDDGSDQATVTGGVAPTPPTPETPTAGKQETNPQDGLSTSKGTAPPSATATAGPIAGQPQLPSTDNPDALTAPVISTPQLLVRQPKPTGPGLTNARTRIASLYAADVKAAQNGGRDDQRKLAKELLRVAEEEPDPAARYVLLCWANNLAIQAMDCGIVQQAVTALARRYELDAVDCHVWAWLKLLQSMGNAKDHPELPVVTDYGLFVLTTLVDHDRFEQLDSISGRLHELSKSATDLRVRDAIRQRLRNAETLGAAYARVDHTGNSPDLGRYYCLLKGDWDRGLPLLASTDGLALAEAAKLDLQKPLDTKSQKTVADKWFAQYQGSPRNSLERTNLRARALYWYSKALASPNLTGLDRTEAERRRTELASATPQPIPGPAPLRLRNQGNFFPIPQKTVADLRRDKMHLEVVGCKGSLQTNVANPRAAFGQPVIIRVPEFAGIQIHVQLTEEGGQTGLAVAPKFEMAPNRVDDFNPESIRRIRNDIQAPVQEARRKLNDRLATRERILRDIDEVALFYPRNFAQKAWKLTTLRNLNVNLGQVNQSITTLSERTIPRLERGAQEAEQRLGHAEGFFGAWPGDLQIHCRVLAQVQEQETEIMTAIIGGAQQT